MIFILKLIPHLKLNIYLLYTRFIYVYKEWIQSVATFTFHIWTRHFESTPKSEQKIKNKTQENTNNYNIKSMLQLATR